MLQIPGGPLNLVAEVTPPCAPSVYGEEGLGGLSPKGTSPLQAPECTQAGGVQDGLTDVMGSSLSLLC